MNAPVLGWRATLVVLSLAAVLGGAPIAYAAPALRTGSVQEYSIKSRHQGRSRRVWVYTPPGYAAAKDTSLGMILAFDGSEYLTEIPLPHLLDSLLAAGANCLVSGSRRYRTAVRVRCDRAIGSPSEYPAISGLALARLEWVE